MKNFLLLSIFVVSCVLFTLATVHFHEKFDDQGWENRWVVSKNKEKEGTAGKFEWTAGKVTGNPKNKGLQTSQDARFYQISAKFKDFSNKDKDLVFQFSVKNEQELDCGGGYFKILPAGLDQDEFSGDSNYNIMFGPDVCGTTKRVHVIFNYKGKNHLVKREVTPKTDKLTHLYSLVVYPNNSYAVFIDWEPVQNGNLVDDWDFLPPKQIPDPKASKPADWVDDAEIPDPEDKKPEGYDSIPATIPDPEAKKPADWDDELDGTWEPPQISNPEYKGEWKPKMIKNPAYQGPWVHPQIENPEYKDDPNIYTYPSNSFVGLEIWQVKSGTVFDNVFVGDNVEEAKKAFEALKDDLAAEKEAADEAEKKEKEEREKAAEEAKKAAAEKKETDAEEKEDEKKEEETDKEEKKDKDEL